MPDSPDESTASSDATAASPLGLLLFVVYSLFYAGFVWVNAFAADAMETIVFGGLNLAIVYGFALILVAIVMSLVYGFARRGDTSGGNDSGGTPSDGQGDRA